MHTSDKSGSRREGVNALEESTNATVATGSVSTAAHACKQRAVYVRA